MIIKKLPWEVFVNNLTFRILIVYIKYELAIISLTIFTFEIAIKIIVKAIAGDIKLSPATARKATIDLKKAVLFETTPNATAKKVARAACYLS
mgnify:CR=1 FL=1